MVFEMEQQIFEQVEVIAYFHKLHIEVLRFKWKTSTYNVSRINSQWKTPSGNSFKYHYVLVCDRQNVICELSYDLNDFKWELVQMGNLN